MIEKLRVMKYRNVKSPQLCIFQVMILGGEAGGKDYKCSISSKRLFLECSLHGHAKRGSLHVKRVTFLKVSMRHLIESNDQNSFFIISKMYFRDLEV